MRVAAVDADVELALRRRVVDRRAVVAVDGVVAIRIDPAQQIARILRTEVAEQVLNRLLARVGARRQQVLPLDTTLHIERRAAVDEARVVVLVQIGRHQLDRPFVAVVAECQIRHRDIEPAVVGDREIAREARGGAIGLADRHGNLMRARRQNLAHREATVAVHRHRQIEGRHRRALRDMFATDRDRTAAHRHVGNRQRVLAPADQAFARRILAVRRGLRAIDDRERLDGRFVEAALGVVHAQHEVQ